VISSKPDAPAQPWHRDTAVSDPRVGRLLTLGIALRRVN